MSKKTNWRALAFSWIRISYFVLSAIFFLLYCLVQEGVRDEARINPHASGDVLIVLIPAIGIIVIAAIIDAIAIGTSMFKRKPRLISFYVYSVHLALAILLLLRTPLRF